MDIYQRILKDHETLRALMDKAENGKGDLRAVYDELQRELWAHAKVEETVFYAALSGSKEARSEAKEGVNEHHLINTLADELGTLEPGGENWKAKVQVLGELLRHHLDEEEEELFEEAREVLDDKRAKALGATFDERKKHALAALAPLEAH